MAEDRTAERREQAERAIAWVNEKWAAPVKTCPVCLANQWQVGDVSELRRFEGGGLVVGGGNILPTFPLVCLNCGYTMLFNAVVSGVLRPDVRVQAETAMATGQAEDATVTAEGES